ncbi:hypothetical protein [Thioalkalivibrio sp.]|uniref:hypothetical protein n=1 Tax=Thioalkalivibrio sp. TaxID=2093813 RepID=UPI0039768413
MATSIEAFVHVPRIAYFSMEIVLRSEIPTYYEIRFCCRAVEANREDGRVLYTVLDAEVLPLFHRDRAGWIRVMQGAIAKNAYYFNSHRMMRRYATAAYIR